MIDKMRLIIYNSKSCFSSLQKDATYMEAGRKGEQNGKRDCTYLQQIERTGSRA